METTPLRSYEVQTAVSQLKASIRDMVRLQRDYQVSDELFWEIFDARVLLDEQIDIEEYIRNFHRTPAYA